MIVVLGQVRTGTSLVQQMLRAAGLRPTGSAPGYEDGRVTAYLRGGRAFPWGKLAPDQSVKWLPAGPQDLPPALPPSATVIFTSRDIDQRIASEWKFLNVMVLDRPPPAMPAEQRRAYEHDHRRTDHAIRRLIRKHRFIELRFEHVIQDPAAAARAVCDLVSDVRPATPAAIDAAAACVRSRSPDCYDGMLEEDLAREIMNAQGDTA